MENETESRLAVATAYLPRLINLIVGGRIESRY